LLAFEKSRRKKKSLPCLLSLLCCLIIVSLEVKESEVGMPEKEEGVVRKEGHKVNKVSGGPNERRKVQVKSVVVLAGSII